MLESSKGAGRRALVRTEGSQPGVGNVGERRRRRAKRASNKSRAGVPRNVGELQSSRASPMMGLGTVGCVPWSPCRLGCHVVAGPWPRCRRQTSWQSPCSPRSVSIEQRTKSTKSTKQTTRPRGARDHCRSVRRCGWPSRILLVGPCACRVPRSYRVVVVFVCRCTVLRALSSAAWPS